MIFARTFNMGPCEVREPEWAVVEKGASQRRWEI